MCAYRIKPCANFLSVLEELHGCPNAPDSIRDHFKLKKKLSKVSKKNTTRNRKVETLNEKSSEDRSCPDLLLVMSDINWCYKEMRERGMKQQINELLDDSTDVYLKEEEPPRNPELVARLERLRNEQANREYAAMTRNISKKQLERNTVSGVGQELKDLHREINRQLITGIQYLISIIGTFFALLVGLSFAIHEFAPRLIVAVIGALVVGLAEIYFIIREDMRAEQTKKTK